MYSKNNLNTSRNFPELNLDSDFLYSSFKDNKVFSEKNTGCLPVMGWNSWNAFGTGNTETLTKIMAEKIVELGLDKLGYNFVVLDDGCYLPVRVNGNLSNEITKFPSGFKSLADFIHSKGLKFGMYNDIGTNLCAGSAVGTCGFEESDAKSYAQWDIDFLKVDNCYYLWDNATFSGEEKAKYSYAPNIKGIKLESEQFNLQFDAVKDGMLAGTRAVKTSSYVSKIGTFDGTNIGTSPVGNLSGELCFSVESEEEREVKLYVEYASGKKEGCGQWLQIAVCNENTEELVFDNLLPETESSETFSFSESVNIILKKGENIIKLMNHRRQENVLCAYGAMFYGLKKAFDKKDVVLSICEWGKTQPHNWGYKIGNSWRILNDITFEVGADGNPGKARWESNDTASITSQYNKAVIMDEFAGLEKGWNDPDMLVIGMNGVSEVMCKTHFTMWCLLNAPLMLGLDLRRISKNDWIYNIIANEDAIRLNQDALGVQAKRIWSSLCNEKSDVTYITNNERVDILVKPLCNDEFALSFINLSESEKTEISIDFLRIKEYLKKYIRIPEKISGFEVFDIWSKKKFTVNDDFFICKILSSCDNYTLRIKIK